MSKHTEDQARFFDGYALRWDSMERADICERLDRVIAEVGVEPGMHILDVGTGTGVIIPNLLRAMSGSGSIDAIDISANMLTVARSKITDACVEFVLCDVTAYNRPDDSYDIVMCNAVYPHFENKQQTLLHINKMLRRGGKIVISHPTGRDAVNKVHRSSSAIVANDLVPSAAEMRLLLKNSGYRDINVIDEADFYIAIATK